VAGDGVPSRDELVTAASLAAEGGTDHVRGPISHRVILNRSIGMGKRAIFQIVLGLSVAAAARAQATGIAPAAPAAPAEGERTNSDGRQPAPARQAAWHCTTNAQCWGGFA
jgi:hypothetical protein